MSLSFIFTHPPDYVKRKQFFFMFTGWGYCCVHRCIHRCINCSGLNWYLARLLLREIYVYVCLSNCRTFSNICLRTSTFWRNDKESTREARPDTLVEVRAPSVSSGARGKPPMLFVSAGVDKTISLVSVLLILI